MVLTSVSQENAASSLLLVKKSGPIIILSSKIQVLSAVASLKNIILEVLFGL